MTNVSTVIKAGQDFRVAQRLTTIDLADHLAEAQRIIQAARAEAKAIVAEGRREAAAALQGAERRGFAEGHARGEAAGFEAGQVRGLVEARERFDRELGTLRDALQAAVSNLEASKRELRLTARQDVLEFAIALGRRVIKRVAELDRSAAEFNLEKALRRISARTDVAVHVNPLDADNLRRFADELAERCAACAHVTIRPDADVAPGGCRVFTPMMRVDADIDTQLDDIARVLVGGRREPSLDSDDSTRGE